MKSKLTVVGLNEINFDFIKYYIAQGKLPNLKQLFDQHGVKETTSEKEYQLLEPWIQWVTVQTGKTFAEHQVFRLGDITDRQDLEQLFEKIERKGKSIGAISPFNVDNRLQNAAFFVPDPWTETKVSGPAFIQQLSASIDRLVNNNTETKMSMGDGLNLVRAILRYVPAARYGGYLNLLKSPKRPGNKAVILDKLLSDVYMGLLKKFQPDFSWLFLNSGAHIQHHYLFNSAPYKGEFKNPEWYCPSGHDPLEVILTEYDNLIGRLQDAGQRIIILTGLHQQPHKHMTYYWRLKNHEAFMQKIGIQNFSKLLPRMSRDFMVEFANEDDTKRAQVVLESFHATKDQKQIFTVDNRGKSLFVELTYSSDIDDQFSIVSKSENINVERFKQYIGFVAIKNGEHNGIGYVASNFDLELPNQLPLTQMHEVILNAVDEPAHNLSYVK